MAGLVDGRVVAIHAGNHCGVCDRCRAGLEHFCQSARGLGSISSDGWGGLAELVNVPSRNLLSPPVAVDAAEATLAEPLGNALRSLDPAHAPEIGVARSAVVIGAGPLGLVHIAALRHYGVPHVVAVEGRGRRRAAALAMGADEVLMPDEAGDAVARRFPVGPDVVVECVGTGPTSHLATTMVRPRGTVVLMGVCTEPFRVNTVRWLVKELTIRTSVGTGPSEQQRALDLIATRAVDVSSLITARIGLDEVADALEALSAGADEIKVVVMHRGRGELQHADGR
jgi:(R,R)-butanediol dehydrogenase/meso-butanediol dehydrogenase/diacetyl reductase